MMKISKSLRDSHSKQSEQYEQLKGLVDKAINMLKDRRWHYESRVKGLESYALKVETGRVNNPNQVEDFFACTLVVENLDSISKAESLIKKRFKFFKRRPERNNFTSKPPDSFRFDDIRLYVKWKDDPANRPSGLDGLLFEVQIKTFLGHAWSIATHDLIYKTDEKSWPKERIAFHIKAMLEHAEISIQEAKTLAKSTSMDKTDKLSSCISKIIKLINKLWSPVLLPHDKKRLAENINNLIRNVGIDLKTLQSILIKEEELGKGPKTLNLSPYTTIIQSLFNQEPEKMKRYLTESDKARDKKRDNKFKVYLPKELELPPSINSAHFKNAVMDADF